MSSVGRALAIVIGIIGATLFGLAAYYAGLRGIVITASSVMTIAFLAGIPLAIGFLAVLPLTAPSREVTLLASWLPLALVLGACWLAQWEGTICIVFALPWLLVFSALGGFLGRRFRERRARLRAAVPVVIAPFVLMPLERRVPLRTQHFTTATSVDIRAPAHVVWEFVVNVDTIRAAERERAFYTTIGFPAPLTATLDHPGRGGMRRAVFERNIVFNETITDWADAELLSFSVDPNTKEIPATSLDRHVTIGGDYFDVLTGTYELESTSDSATRVTLLSDYRVSTHFNWYSRWWARRVMRSVQDNILQVIAARSERAFANAELMLTAEMRELESAMLARGRTTLERIEPSVLNEAMIYTGHRKLEHAGGAMVAEGAAALTAAETLRALLREQAPRARVAGWYIVTDPADSAAPQWRYEVEDRYGRCVAVERTGPTAAAPATAFGPRVLSRCEGGALTAVIERGRRLARLPLDVNSMDVIFTTVGHYPGRVDVFLDSVVVVVRGGQIRTKLLEGRRQSVDSMTASLGVRTGTSWTTGAPSNALVLEWQGMEGETRTLPRLVRFTIPRAADDSLGGRWLVFTHHLTVPKTASNPMGLAWTYAHGGADMFNSVPRR